MSLEVKYRITRGRDRAIVCLYLDRFCEKKIFATHYRISPRVIIWHSSISIIILNLGLKLINNLISDN